MKKLLTLILLTSISLFAASFDCTKATTNVEKMICADEQLSQLDTKLSQIYSSFYFLTQEIKSDQRAWMKKRNTCKESSCVKTFYQQRVEELNTSLANQNTFPRTYLDAMKTAQESMQEVDPQTVTSVPYNKNQSKEFKEDFFRFRNITFKTPLIAEVKEYNDPKLREILGECHGYRFDLQVIKTPHRILKPGEDMYMSPDFDPINPVISREPVINPNLYIWQLNTKGKEWLFVRPKLSGGDYFVVNPNYCKELKYDGDVAKALNRDKELIMNSYTSNNGEVSIIIYNHKEYLITMEGPHKRVYFWVDDVLELAEDWQPLEVVGFKYAAITFRTTDFLNFK